MVLLVQGTGLLDLLEVGTVVVVVVVAVVGCWVALQEGGSRVWRKVRLRSFMLVLHERKRVLMGVIWL